MTYLVLLCGPACPLLRAQLFLASGSHSPQSRARVCDAAGTGGTGDDTTVST